MLGTTARHVPCSSLKGIMRSATTGPALRLVGLTKTFGRRRVVDHLELEVPSGSFFGLVGPNGAGKTTSLSMAVGLLRPDGAGPRSSVPTCGQTPPGPRN